MKTVFIRLLRPRAARTPRVLVGKPMPERRRVMRKKGIVGGDSIDVRGWLCDSVCNIRLRPCCEC